MKASIGTTVENKLNRIRKISISKINPSSLKAGKLKLVLPEIYELESITENNLWHNNQNVFEHVLKVLISLRSILNQPGIDQEGEKKLQEYLSMSVGRCSRLEILTASTLLHDVAKVDTQIENKDGTTQCPGHEMISASYVKAFSRRFGFDKADEHRTERIVKYHGFIFDILILIIANGSEEKYLQAFNKSVGDINLELVLLMWADLLGSDLGKSEKSGFDKRKKILVWMLSRILKAHSGSSSFGRKRKSRHAKGK